MDSVPVRIHLSFLSSIITHSCHLDQAGSGGTALSGAATGGNAFRRDNTFGQGGSAQSGFSGTVNGGGSNNAGGFIFNNPYGSECSILLPHILVGG